MPGSRHQIPALVEHIATKIKRMHPELDARTALRIAISQSQKNGYLRRGKLKLTEKGDKQSAKHENHRFAISPKRFRKMLREEDKKNQS